MPSGIDVFEPAHAENFCASRYLLGNPDLREAFGQDQSLAERHFYAHGRREGRRQVTAAFLADRREKVAKFRITLPECAAESFPISFATSPHQLSDYEGESSNEPPGFWITELNQNPGKLYADIGAGLRHTVWPNCAYVEVYPSLTADILIDADCKLPFQAASLDGIGCFAVLEHVTKPWDLASEFARVVKPGGKIFIDWPFLQPVHGFPSHYYNATREGLRSLFSDNFHIDELYTGAWQSPDYTVYWILSALVGSINDEGLRTKLLETTIGELCKERPQGDMWQAILRTLDDRSVSMLSCGNQLVGTRK